jgi:hypothetical protein
METRWNGSPRRDQADDEVMSARSLLRRLVHTVAPPTGVVYRFRGIVSLLRLRLRRRHGPPPCRISAPRRRARCVVPRDRRASGDVPGGGGAARRWPPLAEIRGAGVPRLPHVRRPGARLRAPPLSDCAFERLVPFSCKGRGCCPSCGGRRMTECADREQPEPLALDPGVGEHGLGGLGHEYRHAGHCIPDLADLPRPGPE